MDAARDSSACGYVTFQPVLRWVVRVIQASKSFPKPSSAQVWTNVPMAKTIGMLVEEIAQLDHMPPFEFSQARLHHDVDIIDFCPGCTGYQPLRFADCYANRSANRDTSRYCRPPRQPSKTSSQANSSLRWDRHLSDPIHLLRRRGDSVSRKVVAGCQRLAGGGIAGNRFHSDCSAGNS